MLSPSTLKVEIDLVIIILINLIYDIVQTLVAFQWYFLLVMLWNSILKESLWIFSLLKSQSIPHVQSICRIYSITKE